MHYQGRNDDGSWHEPIAELSGTGNEGIMMDLSDGDTVTICTSDFGGESIPEADEVMPHHLLADHYLSAGALVAGALLTTLSLCVRSLCVRSLCVRCLCVRCLCCGSLLRGSLRAL